MQRDAVARASDTLMEAIMGNTDREEKVLAWILIFFGGVGVLLTLLALAAFGVGAYFIWHIFG